MEWIGREVKRVILFSVGNFRTLEILYPMIDCDYMLKSCNKCTVNFSSDTRIPKIYHAIV